MMLKGGDHWTAKSTKQITLSPPTWRAPVVLFYPLCERHLRLAVPTSPHHQHVNHQTLEHKSENRISENSNESGLA